MTSVTLRDCQPVGTGTVNGYEPTLEGNHRRHQFVVTESMIRVMCGVLTVATPICHPIASVVNVVYLSIRLVSLSHFWLPKEETAYSFTGRLKDAGEDLLRVVATPIALVGLELAALYGILSPRNGGALYGSIERALYGEAILTPFY